jgi:hypothetical protein
VCTVQLCSSKVNSSQKNDQLGLLLGDEERSNSGSNTWSCGMKRVRVFQPPALGAPIDERMQGFWSLCYPELFPFGYGCFNEPRSVEVDWTEWASWVIHQDFGILRSRLKGNALPLQISLETTSEVIRKATGWNTKVEFKGSPKRRGTKSFDRWSLYCNNRFSSNFSRCLGSRYKTWLLTWPHVNCFRFFLFIF